MVQHLSFVKLEMFKMLCEELCKLAKVRIAVAFFKIKIQPSFSSDRPEKCY